jgi:crotonobetainyl-CoA:carnitine CoA-transferase CaiB-like acyl-CoA transferase
LADNSMLLSGKQSCNGPKVDGPLRDIRVYELGNSVAGPYASLILGELGADVIKVEAPGGDYARTWGPPFLEDGSAASFAGLNRNKRGVVVDLTDEKQRRTLVEDIVARGDVVICNLRSGVAARFGVDAASLRALAPGLIYCDIGAFGSRGPLSGEPGYDPLMQASGGLMSITGEDSERPPVRVGVSIVDMGAGLWAVIGVLASLLERRANGVGGHVETSLFEVAVAWMNLHVSGFLASGEIRRPHGSGLAEIVPYQAFRTADGWLMVAAGNDRLFTKLCTALELNALAADERAVNNPTRVANRAFVVGVVQARLLEGPTAEWQAKLSRVGVPNAPIQNIAQLIDDPQLAALGMIQNGPEGALPTVGLPISFGGVRPAFVRPAPKLGQHTNEILSQKVTS